MTQSMKRWMSEVVNFNIAKATFALLIIISLILFTVATVTGESQKDQLAPPCLNDALIQNDYLGIAVEDTSSRFTLGNTGGDPANPNDNNQILLYGHPYPWFLLQQ